MRLRITAKDVSMSFQEEYKCAEGPSCAKVPSTWFIHGDGALPVSWSLFLNTALKGHTQFRSPLLTESLDLVVKELRYRCVATRRLLRTHRTSAAPRQHSDSVDLNDPIRECMFYGYISDFERTISLG
jgi:hypothetical protein